MYSVTEEEVKKRLAQITGLKQYVKFSPEELRKIAEELVIKSKKREDLNVSDLFQSEDEQKRAKTLLDKYIQEYTIETVSDRNILKQLIYLEVLNTRIQDSLNNYTGPDKDLVKLIDVIHKNLSQILILKTELGLSGSKNKQNEANALETLKKKFKNYLKENQASRTLVCPHCSQMILLRIRTTAYEAQKHPFFRDRILYNKPLLALYKEGKLTQKDVASVLECSEDYIEWVINKIEKNRIPPDIAEQQTSGED